MTDGLKPGWRRWRFEQMATNVNVRVDDPAEAGVDYYVGLEHLDSDSVKIRRWGSPGDVTATKLLFEPGDIIFGRRRAYQRKLGVAEWRGIASAHSLVLRAKPDVVLPEFLPFFMQSDLFMERAQQISVGSLSPTINWKTLAREEFELPPLEEQRRIAFACTKLDGLIGGLQDAISINAKVRDSIVKDFFQSTDVIFSITRLEVIGQVSYGVTVNQMRRKFQDQLPYLRVANVQRGCVDLTEVKSIGTTQGDSDYELRKHDILMVEGHADAGEIGRAAIWNSELERALHQNHLIRFRPDVEIVMPEFALAFLNSSIGRTYFRSRAKSTSGLNTINSTVVKAMPIPLPCIDDQSALCSRLRECDEAIAHLRNRLTGTLGMRKAFVIEAGL